MDPPEEVILAFFQLPDETIEELRLLAKKNGIEWYTYLLTMYREFVFVMEV